MYAIQRPSGEKAPQTSRDGVFSNTERSPGRGLARFPPAAAATQRSLLVWGSVLWNRTNRPSRDQLLGVLTSSEATNRSSVPAPLASFS